MTDGTMGRRIWIKTGALGLTSLAINPSVSFPASGFNRSEESAKEPPASFNHR
jgi:hypothetical protein